MSCTASAQTSLLLPPLRVTRGASKAWLFTVRIVATKAARDITGAKVWFTIKNRVEDVAAVVTKRNALAGGVDNQVLIVVPQSGLTLGQFKVFLDPADTAMLDPVAAFWCDAWVQLVGGPPIKRYQVMKNRQLILEPAVTTVF